MGNRSVSVFQTLDDCLELISKAQKSEEHRILFLSSGREEACPRELIDIEHARCWSFLLCRQDFFSSLELSPSNGEGRFINALDSPVILVNLSRVIESKFYRGRYFFRTLRLVRNQEQLSQEDKSTDFVKWADSVLRLVKRTAHKLEVPDKSAVYILPKAQRIIAEKRGQFDTQLDYIFDLRMPDRH